MVTVVGSGWREDVVNQCLEFGALLVSVHLSTDVVSALRKAKSVNLVLNVHRRGEGGTEAGGEVDYILISLHCHHQNDT